LNKVIALLIVLFTLKTIYKIMKKQIFFSILISAAALSSASAQSDVVAPPVQTKPAKVEQPAGLKVADGKTAGKPGNGNEAIKKAAQEKKAKSAGAGKGAKNGAGKGGKQQKEMKKMNPKDRPSEAGAKTPKASPGNQNTAPLEKKSNKGKVNSGFTPSGQ
jgi:hypothetical protein